MYTDTNKDKTGMPIAFKSIASKQVWKHFTKKGAPWSCLVILDNHYIFFMKNTMKKKHTRMLCIKKNEREAKLAWNSKERAASI